MSLDPGGTTCHGASSAAYTPTEKAQSFHLLPSVAKLFSSSILGQVSMATESVATIVHLGIPPYQPRSEHDGEQIHRLLKSGSK